MRKAIVFFFNIIFILTPLVFFAGTSEVFEFNKMVLVYFLTSIIAGFWIIRMMVEKKAIFRRTIIDIPLAIFFFSQLISTLLSIDQRTSIFGYYSRFNGGLLSTVSYIILYWAFVSNVNLDDVKQIIRNALITAVFISIYGILEHFGISLSCFLLKGELNVDCWVQDVKTRVFATLGQPNWMAAYLVALIPLSIVNLQQNIDTKIINIKEIIQKKLKSLDIKTVLKFLTPLIIFLAILFTKSRSGLLGFAVAMLVFWCFKLIILAKQKEIKKIIPLFLTINIFFALIVVLFGSSWTPSINKLVSKKSTSTTSTSIVDENITGPALESGGTESGEIRKIVWTGAMNIWQAYPVFGSGLETFAYSYYQYRPVEHNMVSEWDFLYNKAHNEYLNFLANTGTVGFISYISLIIFSLALIIKTKRVDILAGYISILVTNFFGFSVVVTQLLLFLLPGIAIATTVKVEEEKTKVLNGSQKFGVTIILVITFYILSSIYKYWLADYFYATSKSQIEQSMVAASIENLSKAVKTSPNEPLYHDRLAQIYSSLATYYQDKNATDAGEFVNASVREINIAKDISPRNMVILQNTASIYSELGLIDDKYLLNSVEELEKLTTYAPNYAKFYYKLGMAYKSLNQKTKALQNFKKALDLKPNYEEAKRALNLI